MKQFITFVVHHAVSTLMLILAITICGIISLFVIKVDYLPSLSNRFLLVSAEFEGIPAVEMRKLVTIPLEDSFASLKGIKNTSSVTRDGVSLVQIELHWGTSADLAITERRSIIDSCYKLLPAGCSKPDVEIYDLSNKDTVTITVAPKDDNICYCRYIADTDFKQRFQRIKGVSAVTVTGGTKEELHVLVNQKRLEMSHLNPESIANTLSQSNFEYPAGVLHEGENDILFKTTGLYTSLDDIADTPLLYSENGLIRLSDIATVERGVAKDETFSLHDGKEVVCIGIHKNNGASPLSLYHDVEKEIATMQEQYQTQYTFTITRNASNEIIISLLTLLISAAIGIFITVAILKLFLKSNLISIITASVIPLCALFAILILTACGKSINLLSLSGIAVGIGMVVDPSTIVLERIHSLYSQKQFVHYRELVTIATSDVSPSSIGSTLTTIIVFIPFLFLNGLLGELFGDMAIAIISAISFSCILSLTYTPALYYLATKGKPLSSKGISITRLERRYGKALSYTMSKTFCVPLIIASCLALGMAVFPLLNIELFPQTRTTSLSVSISFPHGTTITKMKETAIQLNDALSASPQFTSISINGGMDSGNKRALFDCGKIDESLVLTAQIQDSMAAKEILLALTKGTNLMLSFISQQDMISEVLACDTDGYVLMGASPDNVREQAKTIRSKSALQFIPDNYVTERVFTPDRAACSRFSITASYTAQLSHDTLEGVITSPFYSEGREIPILVKFSPDSMNSVEQLENTMVLLEDSCIPIKSLGSIRQQQCEKILYRYNRNDAKQIQSNGMDISSPQCISLMKKQISELFSNALFLLVIVLILLYCVMGAQFESFVIPLLIMISLIPAFSGAFIMLLITRQSINCNSVIALVVLFGTSVNNAIMLYEGISTSSNCTHELTIAFCTKKLRPVIITTLTTICALIPFAIDPLKLNAQSSMAIAIIGGLTLSLFIVLLAVPPLLFKCIRGRS